MKRIKIFVRFIVELLFLGSVILALVVVINTLIPRQQLASQQVVSTISPYPPPAYLTPKAMQQITSNPYPPSVGTNPTPSPVMKETPYPTLIPFPTNTLKPGPKPTPIPLIPPAKNATGNILFLSRDSNSAKSALTSLNVDFSGKPKNEATIISTYEIPESEVYPSPDGQNIIFTIDSEGGPVGTILDLNTGKVGPILNGRRILAFFNWYPDSKHILVQLDGNGLWLFDVNSEKGIPLAVPRLGAIGGAAASPDGQKVIYSHVMGCCSPSEVWIVNADGRDAFKLFDVGHVPISFSWSPDGSKIAFFGDGLMVMNADGTQLRSISHQPMNIGLSVPAIWSPDSRYLAIDTLRSPSPNSIPYDKSNIYIIDVNTGVERPLLSDEKLGNLDPAWSPDGSMVAFVSNRSGAPEIWEVNTDGKNLLQLTQNGKILRLLNWHS